MNNFYKAFIMMLMNLKRKKPPRQLEMPFIHKTQYTKTLV